MTMIQTMFLVLLYLIGVIASYYIAIYRSVDIGWIDWLYVFAWPVIMIWIGAAGIYDWLFGRES